MMQVIYRVYYFERTQEHAFRVVDIREFAMSQDTAKPTFEDYAAACARALAFGTPRNVSKVVFEAKPSLYPTAEYEECPHFWHEGEDKTRFEPCGECEGRGVFFDGVTEFECIHCDGSGTIDFPDTSTCPKCGDSER